MADHWQFSTHGASHFDIPPRHHKMATKHVQMQPTNQREAKQNHVVNACKIEENTFTTVRVCASGASTDRFRKFEIGRGFWENV